MNLLKWLIEKEALPQTANGPRSVCLNAGGNGIVPEWHSQWRPGDCGIHETRRHVGRSAEGFHPGIEACHRAGMGRIEWGEAQPTPEVARAHSVQMENARRERIPICVHVPSTAMGRGCCLYSRVDAGVEIALLELRVIVAMIENDPAHNWPRYNCEFERAVAGLQQSIVALRVRQGQR
jgi:hypothetical protein